MKHAEGLKAIIIGGGIGGLTTAIALQRVGIRVTVFERANDLLRIQAGAGLHIWNNAMRVLQTLGLADRMQSMGLSLEWAEFRSWQNELLAAWPVGDLGRKLGIPTLCIRRSDIHRVLTEAQDEGALQLGAVFKGFTQDRQGVTVHFKDGREERGDFLIGADGINSVVRAQQLGVIKPTYAGYTVWRGLVDFNDDQTPVGVFRSMWGHGQRFIYYHVSPEKLYWSTVANAPEGERSDEKRVKAELLDRYRKWPQLIQSIIEATNESTIQRLDTYELDPLKSWGHGRVTLLGDAAHSMSFNVGQGACQAIEDAIVLTKCLGEDSDVATALRNYETLRMKRTSGMQNLARRLGAMGKWVSPWACGLRNTFMKLTYNGPVFKGHTANVTYEA